VSKRNRPDPPNGFLWVDQAAAYLGLTKYSLYKWRQNGIGPEGEVTGQRRLIYEISLLDEFRAWQAAGGTPADFSDSRRTLAAA
jgi:hypothetical protein